MRRLCSFLFTTLILVSLLIPTTAFAVEERTGGRASLSFSGTTATCAISYGAGKTTDYVSVTLVLTESNGSEVDSWTASGYGVVNMSKTANVTRGETYTLTSYCYVNNSLASSNSVTRTCS